RVRPAPRQTQPTCRGPRYSGAGLRCQQFWPHYLTLGTKPAAESVRSGGGQRLVNPSCHDLRVPGDLTGGPPDAMESEADQPAVWIFLCGSGPCQRLIGAEAELVTEEVVLRCSIRLEEDAPKQPVYSSVEMTTLVQDLDLWRGDRNTELVQRHEGERLQPGLTRGVVQAQSLACPRPTLPSRLGVEHRTNTPRRRESIAHGGVQRGHPVR